MITLYLLDKICMLIHNINSSYNPLSDWFSSIGDKINALAYPQDLIQIFGIVKCFLPSSTIITLFVITAVLTSIVLVSGLIKFILHLSFNG